MPITLFTGKPGHGKTLYALNYVPSKFKDRQIYYSGIADLKLPWTEIEKGEDWHTVPDGSVVVIDECQRSFRPRGTGAQVPEHVALLETHRHRGIDLVFITQHPMLIESNVRRLCDKHFHVVRAFGTHKATVHEFTEVRTDCEAGARRSDSIKHIFSYPERTFGLYKSAEVHTVKRQLPMRVYLLMGLPLLILGLLWYGWYAWSNRSTTPPVVKPSGVSSSSSVTGSHSEPVKDWFDQQKPRVLGLAYTAPAYDEIAKPQQLPSPSACVASKSTCSCFTDQATRLDMPVPLCRKIVAFGYFQSWKKTQDRPQKEAVAARSDGAASPLASEAKQVLSLQPQKPAETSNVLTLPDATPRRHVTSIRDRKV